jgi:dTDP-4-dehydrorhamnose reductase
MPESNTVRDFVASRQRIAITGATGQLGRALIECSPSHTDIVAVSRPDVDITDWKRVRSAIAIAAADIVIHAAAATDVDGCERDPQMAYEINARGSRNVAQAAALAGATLVYVSTNFVFDGAKTEAYHEWDVPAPISVYGASKLAGEREALTATPQCFVVRTAQIYAESGHNFVLTMRRLMEEREELRVVADQYGNPTYAPDLASAIFAMLANAPFGTYHLVNDGVVSWYEWATEIRSMTASSCDVVAISATEYQRDARPPANGGMISLMTGPLGISLPDWRDALRRCLST